MAAKPETREQIAPIIESLSTNWEDLESTTKEKVIRTVAYLEFFFIDLVKHSLTGDVISACVSLGRCKIFLMVRTHLLFIRVVSLLKDDITVYFS